MKVLAIIPARGGSKGIPKKNIIELNDKPLITYTIEAAQKSKRIDKIFLSSDDSEIIEVAKNLGISSTYIRPKYLASDEATTIDAILDSIEWLENQENYFPDVILLLQPTSPLRTAEDIDGAIDLFEKHKESALVSVHEMIEHPFECVYDIYKKDWKYLAQPKSLSTRRQDYAKSFYYINGALYLANINFLKREKTFIKSRNTIFYEIPQERGLDVDEFKDLERAEFYLKSYNNED